MGSMRLTCVAYCPTVTIEGVTHTLAQFHGHIVSEHTVDGRHSDMEFHFVYQNKQGGLAVYGQMLTYSPSNVSNVDESDIDKLFTTPYDSEFVGFR